jgi:y4mF family transcriptional regulator
MVTSVTTPRDISATVRGRRQKLKMSQTALAEKAGVSRAWLHEFERGKPTAELQLVLRVLESLDLELTLESKDQPDAPGSKPTQKVDLDQLLLKYSEPWQTRSSR